jgi:hypothetical protein
MYCAIEGKQHRHYTSSFHASSGIPKSIHPFIHPSISQISNQYIPFLHLKYAPKRLTYVMASASDNIYLRHGFSFKLSPSSSLVCHRSPRKPESPVRRVASNARKRRRNRPFGTFTLLSSLSLSRVPSHSCVLWIFFPIFRLAFHIGSCCRCRC